MNRKSSQAELAPATISEADGVRYLHLGTPWVQGAMRLREPLKLELDYVQRMMAWMLLRPEAQVNKGHAVQFGLGAAAITRFSLGRLRMRSTVVEINPTVITACRMFFKLPDDSPRLQVLNMDAAAYAADPAHAGTVQALCVDLYDHEAAAPVLDSVAFYRHCRRLLDEEGVMSVNLFGCNASFDRSAGRIAAAFGADRVRSLRPTREGNTILLAWRGGDMPDRDTLAARADNIETRFGLPARKWLRMIQALPTDMPAPPTE
jgi:spermidine synthase